MRFATIVVVNIQYFEGSTIGRAAYHEIVAPDMVLILWLGGPSVDSPLSMNIFAVDSVEEARRMQRNDPHFAHVNFYDDQYFEWIVHMPYGMVSPAHKEGLERLLRECGIAPESL